MKRRAWRVTIAAALAGVGVVCILVVAHWGRVRDHVEMWRFQRRDLRSITPGDCSFSLKDLTELLELLKKDGAIDFHASSFELFSLLADGSGYPVFLDPLFASDLSIYRVLTKDLEALRVADTLRILKDCGFRVLEQYLPTRAYVVVGHEVRSEADGIGEELAGEEPAMRSAGFPVDEEPALEVQIETVEEEADSEGPMPVTHRGRLRRTFK